MVKNTSMPQSSIIPELGYSDVHKAAEWLSRAFGFKERLRIGGHRIQLTYGTGDLVVMEGPELNGETPMTHRIMVRVVDADAHCLHAKQAGAHISREPETFPYGERQYSAIDIGGHAWTFSQSVADIDPRSWGGTLNAHAA